MQGRAGCRKLLRGHSRPLLEPCICTLLLPAACPLLLVVSSTMQSSAVRMTAADNLGQLTRLSARVEVLVADLANSAATAAEPDTAAAYLTALSGALGASGDRLTPPTLEKVQASLLGLYRSTGSRPSSTSGTVDPAAAALATALARYASVAGPAGLSAVLEAGPLGPKALGGSPQERELAAMLLAAVAAAAAGCITRPHLEVSTADEQVDLCSLCSLHVLQCGIYVVQLAMAAPLYGNLCARMCVGGGQCVQGVKDMCRKGRAEEESARQSCVCGGKTRASAALPGTGGACPLL